jgi:hypothetical protein
MSHIDKTIKESVTYSFYLESMNIAATGKTPAFVNFFDISDNTDLVTTDVVLPVIEEVGGGFYKFAYEWTKDEDPIAYLLKIDTGLDDLVEKYITMRIEKTDYMSSAVQRIVDIEQGTWEIDSASNQLVIKHAETGVEIGRWDLLDSGGITGTSRNPFYRVAVNVQPY